MRGALENPLKGFRAAGGEGSEGLRRPSCLCRSRRQNRRGEAAPFPSLRPDTAGHPPEGSAQKKGQAERPALSGEINL